MKKLFSILITLSLTAVAFSANALGAESGVCGENLTYSIENGILTISGSGDMYNTPYEPETYFDWVDAYELEDYSSVVLESGITSIGAFAFEVSPIDSIVIPYGVVSIEDGAFAGAELSSITLPASLKNIEIAAFMECDNLTEVYYNGTEKQWNEIEIEDENQALTSAEIFFTESTELSDSDTEKEDSSEIETSEPAVSNSNDIIVIVNGEILSFDQPPVISEGRTLVPLRGIFEALGASVEWNSENQEICAIKGNTVVAAGIGANYMYKIIMSSDVTGSSYNDILELLDYEDSYVDGEEIELDVAPVIMNGRTLVPVRAIAEAFDCQVGWDDSTRTVSITTD